MEYHKRITLYEEKKKKHTHTHTTIIIEEKKIHSGHLIIVYFDSGPYTSCVEKKPLRGYMEYNHGEKNERKTKLSRSATDGSLRARKRLGKINGRGAGGKCYYVYTLFVSRALYVLYIRLRLPI